MAEKCWNKLMWVPNIIGYARLAMAIVGGSLINYYPAFALVTFTLNFSLDGIDGYLARKLNQTSTFGAWLDVFVDLVSRGIVWCNIHPMVGYCVMCWEWLAFLSIHTDYGKDWKRVQKAPHFVTAVMSNNFKTVQGFYIVGSIFLLPLCCCAKKSGLVDYCGVSQHIQLIIFMLLLAGRILAALVEAWFIKQHLHALLLTKEKIVPKQN